MRAMDIMTTDVATVRPETPVREAAALLAQRRCTSLPVLNDDDWVIGIVSEVDLIRDRMPHDPRSQMIPVPASSPDPSRLVGEVMTDTVVCMAPTADTATIARAMVENGIRAVPIVDGARLVGIVSRRDILRSLLRDDTAIAADARQRLDDYAGEAGRWHVEVDDGVVTVSGRTDDVQRSVIDALLRTIPGVVRVHIRHGLRV